ncbi:serine carboxypeptidase-like protein, partial [Reticulomyxa filosa]
AVAVGNPYVQRDENFFQGWLVSMYDFGIINDNQYAYLISGNCSEMVLTPSCSNQVWSFIDSYLWNDINAYDVNVDHNCSTRSRQRDALLRNVHKSYQFETNLENGNIWAYPYASCDDQNLIGFLNNGNFHLLFFVCFFFADKLFRDYHLYIFAIDKTKKALHVNTKKAKNTWEYCAFSWSGYDANGTDDAVDQVPHYQFILRNGVRVLIYSGNVDLVVAYSATRYWIFSPDYLGNDTKSTGAQKTDWHSWKVNGEVGGWMQVWENFAFAVVRDAGHEVPEYQPERAFSLFDRFLRNDYNDTPLQLNAYEKNFADYGSEPQSTNEFWKGFGIGVASMVGITGLATIIVYGWCWYKRKHAKVVTSFPADHL